MSKKRFFAGLLALVMALTMLAGCGGGDKPASPAPTSPAPDQGSTPAEPTPADGSGDVQI